VFIDGKEVRCPKGTYYIDYTDSLGKRVRTSVGTVAAEAQASRLRKEAELRAIAQGLSVLPGDDGPLGGWRRPAYGSGLLGHTNLESTIRYLKPALRSNEG